MAAAPPVMIIQPPVPEIDQIKPILDWIGFSDVGYRTRITDDTFTTYNDFLMINEKDITEPSASFHHCTAANDKIGFGI